MARELGKEIFKVGLNKVTTGALAKQTSLQHAYKTHFQERLKSGAL
jgi:hypothetical protein